MNLDAIKTRLADNDAMLDIEVYCHAERENGYLWFNTKACLDSDQIKVDEAVFYLETRRLLVRDPENPSWVRFLSPDERDTDQRGLLEIAEEHGLQCFLRIDEQHPIYVLGTETSIDNLRRLIERLDEAAAPTDTQQKR